jgi:hypothetical protein
MMGSIEETNVNNKEVQQVVDLVLKFYNDKNDDLYASREVQVANGRCEHTTGA